MVNQATFQVEGVFSIRGRGIIATGKAIEGVIKKGMRSIINGKQSEILVIEVRNMSMDSLTTNDMPAGLLLSNVDLNDIQKGNKYCFQ
ncbi:MAG: hypothetical protein NTW73_02000 [Candidatus Parcubacteria bacterium]|nr:hypothetical protein [Candidatus Parcubacteria bacterium]